jgi:cytidylate kinase
MKKTADRGKYIPGTYARRKTNTEELVGYYAREWENKILSQKKEAQAAKAAQELRPSITFSRKIGVGALEIADIVAKKLEIKVADRELIEKIAQQADTSEKAIAFFDERFPGYGNRTVKFLFGEKSFIDSDYARHLVSAITGIAGLGSTAFVGRGAHLILPRERVLAVRCICSDDYRIERVANLMGIDKAKAKKQLSAIDKEQAAFFKKAFNQKAALPYEFDMVLNLDHFARPEDTADIVTLAFNKKFNTAG